MSWNHPPHDGDTWARAWLVVFLDLNGPVCDTDPPDVDRVVAATVAIAPRERDEQRLGAESRSGERRRRRGVTA